MGGNTTAMPLSPVVHIREERGGEKEGAKGARGGRWVHPWYG